MTSPVPQPVGLEEVLAVLRRERQTLCAESGVDIVGVVGSLARGDARPDSDVDVVFDALPSLDYWSLGGAISRLRARFGRPVDMVDRQMMRPDRWAWMSRDFIPLA